MTWRKDIFEANGLMVPAVRSAVPDASLTRDCVSCMCSDS
jgi:hypothetical protein